MMGSTDSPFLMATLVDFEIERLAKRRGLVSPYEPRQLNPASYDVTLGTVFKTPDPKAVFSPNLKEEEKWKTTVLDAGESLHLPPNGFILAHTQEFLHLADDIEAQFILKSSRGREGWNHALSGYIDPGYSGQITLELKNYNPLFPLELYPGMRIGQIKFSLLDVVPHKTYKQTGRYNNAQGVETSKG